MTIHYTTTPTDLAAVIEVDICLQAANGFFSNKAAAKSAQDDAEAAAESAVAGSECVDTDKPPVLPVHEHSSQCGKLLLLSLYGMIKIASEWYMWRDSDSDNFWGIGSPSDIFDGRLEPRPGRLPHGPRTTPVHDLVQLSYSRARKASSKLNSIMLLVCRAPLPRLS